MGARTEFRDEVSAEEASASKDGDDVAADGAVSRHARRDDRFSARQRNDVVQRTLKAQSTTVSRTSDGKKKECETRYLALEDERALSAQEVRCGEHQGRRRSVENLHSQ